MMIPTALTGSDADPAQAFAFSDDWKMEVVIKIGEARLRCETRPENLVHPLMDA